jgi:hypothetical protein
MRMNDTVDGGQTDIYVYNLIKIDYVYTVC